MLFFKIVDGIDYQPVEPQKYDYVKTRKNFSSRSNYSEKILDAVAELERLFDKEGAIDTSAGIVERNSIPIDMHKYFEVVFDNPQDDKLIFKMDIERDNDFNKLPVNIRNHFINILQQAQAPWLLMTKLRETFGFDEIAGFSFDRVRAKRDDLSNCIKCWGQQNYKSVHVNDEFVSKGVKTLFIMNLLEKIGSAGFSSSRKMQEFLPNNAEHFSANNHVWLEQNGKPLMYIVENFLAFNDEKSSVEKEIDGQVKYDWEENYKDYENKKIEYFKQIGFIPIYIDDKRIDFIMVRNLLGAIKDGKEIPLYPEQNEHDTNLFIEALGIFVSQYNMKLKQIMLESGLKASFDKTQKIVSGIVHDVRNPLVAVGGYAKRILKIIGEKKDLSEEEIAKIIKSAEVILSESVIMEQSLTSRTDKKEIYEDVKEKININDVITQAIESRASILREDNITVSYETQAMGLMINDVKPRIESYIANVLDNAIKYTRTSSSSNRHISISIKAEKYKSRFAYDNEYDLVVEIKDSGEGIDQDLLNRRVYCIKKGLEVLPDEMMKAKKERSNGVGLSKSVPFLVHSDDDFWINSVAGEGTTVGLRLMGFTAGE